MNQVFAFVGFGTSSHAEINIDNIIIHPGFDLPLNDIAVVKVKRNCAKTVLNVVTGYSLCVKTKPTHFSG